MNCTISLCDPVNGKIELFCQSANGISICSMNWRTTRPFISVYNGVEELYVLKAKVLLDDAKPHSLLISTLY